MQAWSREQRVGGAARRLRADDGCAARRPPGARSTRHADTATSSIVSIFVNPLQFNRGDDFDSYPRPIDDDVASCDAQRRRRGVRTDRGGRCTRRASRPTSSPARWPTSLEGAGRPGHFRGVTTVVAKLFGAIRPDVAVFGQKDFQQLAIIRRMVADLDLGHRDRRRADGPRARRPGDLEPQPTARRPTTDRLPCASCRRSQARCRRRR